jgi:hypothetical protein
MRDERLPRLARLDASSCGSSRAAPGPALAVRQLDPGDVVVSSRDAVPGVTGRCYAADRRRREESDAGVIPLTRLRRE